MTSMLLVLMVIGNCLQTRIEEQSITWREREREREAVASNNTSLSTTKQSRVRSIEEGAAERSPLVHETSTWLPTHSPDTTAP